MIKRYDPIIYPRKLWVAVNSTYKEISDNFIHNLSEQKFNELSDSSKAATLDGIIHRRSKYKGDLEQNAYLLGWVAECIHKTLSKK